MFRKFLTYWAVPLVTKPLTVFETPICLFQFREIPFRLAAIWPEHIDSMYEILTKLSESKLTTRLSKCFICFQKLER